MDPSLSHFDKHLGRFRLKAQASVVGSNKISFCCSDQVVSCATLRLRIPWIN